MQFPLNLLLAGVVIVLAWTLNLSVICAMRSLNSGTRVVYSFLISMCVANLFLATIDFPPPIISKILVSRQLQHVMCVSWTYLDTLLCNVLILHLLGCSLDSYLRLKHPSRYLDSTKKVLTCLKLSAPWTLSFVQSTAFMAIAQISEFTIQDGVCFISDPNFLILRSVMCFGFPISVSSILVFLSAKSLSNFKENIKFDKTIDKNKENVRQSETEDIQLHAQGDHPINRDETQETIVRLTDDQNHLVSSPSFESTNTLDFYQHKCPQHGILSIPIDKSVSVFPNSLNMPKYEPFMINNPHDLLYQCCSTHLNLKNSINFSESLYGHNLICSTGNQHCPDVVPIIQSPIGVPNTYNVANDLDLRNLTLHQSRSSGDIHDTHSSYLNLPGSRSLDFQKLYENCTMPEIQTIANPRPPNLKTKYLLRSYERTTIAINLSLCIISILFWGPFIIGSLIQGICKPPFCVLPISNPRINEFKWLSYVLCIIYPLDIFIIDSDLRKIIKSSLNC